MRILLRALGSFVWFFDVWHRRNLRIYQRPKNYRRSLKEETIMKKYHEVSAAVTETKPVEEG